MKNKKGVSPVIATVLLVAMVVVLAMIVILWFTSFTQEAITKFDNENVELVCRNKIAFDSSYSGGLLSVVNTGNSPIYRMNIKTETGGEYSTSQLEVSSGWPQKGLNPGKSAVAVISADNADKITIIPVLLGNSDSGMRTFACDEKEAGKEVTA